MYKAVIIDDNKIARMMLSELLKQMGNIEIINEFESATEALPELKKKEVDLLFLDVEMPGMSGIELLKILPNRPLTILISAQPSYAVEAFELNVVDFLVKPFTLQRVVQAVERAVELLAVKNSSLSQVEKDYIFIKDGKVIRKVFLNAILWIEAKGDYMRIVTLDEKFIIHATLRSLEEKLPGTGFLRIHRSYIIAISKIDFIEDGIAHVQGRQIPVSDSYKSELLKKLQLI